MIIKKRKTIVKFKLACHKNKNLGFYTGSKRKKKTFVMWMRGCRAEKQNLKFRNSPEIKSVGFFFKKQMNNLFNLNISGLKFSLSAKKKKPKRVF